VPGNALDTVVTAETPEGILLELRPAGLSPRFFAFLIDLLIQLAAIYVVSMVASIGGRSGLAIAGFFIFAFLLQWFYPVVFELSRSGSTPGKKAFGLRVVMDNGLPITPGASLTRNLLRFADAMPAFFGFAIVSMLLRKDCKRLGDIAAATLVVHEPLVAPKIELTQVEPLPPARPLSPEDQAAVVALAARAPTLTGERLDELAALAAPVSGDEGRAGPEVTRRVLGVAMYLLGKRA
jgi:uncharacterized RDD family membrane protein YckC